MVDAYNQAHPGVTVNLQFMEDKAFKQKLPTLLQSDAAPDLFFSWSGGVFYEQADQGFLRPIPAATIDQWKNDLSAGGLAALSYKGKYYGAPEASQNVAIWYNKDLAKKVGVDPTQIKTYDDFFDQVKAAKAVGVTPIIVGGQDKWPLHFLQFADRHAHHGPGRYDGVGGRRQRRLRQCRLCSRRPGIHAADRTRALPGRLHGRQIRPRQPACGATATACST